MMKPFGYQRMLKFVFLLVIPHAIDAQQSHKGTQPMEEVNIPLAGWASSLDTTKLVVIPERSSNSAKEIVFNNLHSSKRIESVYNTVDLKIPRGEIEFEGVLETSNLSDTSSAAIYCNATNHSRQTIAFENMDENPLASNNTRKKCRITLFFDQPIEKITVGFYISGAGTIKATQLSLKAGRGEFSSDWEKDILQKIKNDTSRIKYLAKLAETWGFLKYNNPNITRKGIDWDSVLINTIPQFFSQNFGSEKFNEIIHHLILSAGPVLPSDSYWHVPGDSLLINYDTSWIADAAFSKKNQYLLNVLRHNNDSTENFYVQLNSGSGQATFDNERPYRHAELPGYKMRLLALFRYWNIIRYFYPYKYTLTTPWTNTLNELIPIFIKARTLGTYRKAVVQMIASIHDSHAYDYTLIRRATLEPPLSMLPMEFLINDNKIYISEIDSVFGAENNMQRGDRILSINDNDISYYRNEYTKYISGSNEYFINKNLARLIPFVKDSIVNVKIKNADGILEKKILIHMDALQRFLQAQNKRYLQSKNPLSFKLIGDSILYLNVGNITLENVDTILSFLKTKKIPTM